MDGNQLGNDILSRLLTVNRRNEIITEIDTLLYNLNSIDIENSSEETIIILQQAKHSGDIEAYLNQTKDYLLNLPIFELTIAITPTRKEVKDLALLVRQEISQNAILDLQIDPYIVAGAIISYNGKYFDGSLRNKLKF